MLISCFMIMKLNYEMNDSSEKKETHDSQLTVQNSDDETEL